MLSYSTPISDNSSTETFFYLPYLPRYMGLNKMVICYKKKLNYMRYTQVSRIFNKSFGQRLKRVKNWFDSNFLTIFSTKWAAVERDLKKNEIFEVELLSSETSWDQKIVFYMYVLRQALKDRSNSPRLVLVEVR